MCITGCSPKRAGVEFFSELEDSPLNIKELAKKHKVDVKVVELPVKLIVKNGKLDEKVLSNWVRGLAGKSSIGDGKMVYQGAFLVAEEKTIEYRNLFFSIIRRIWHYLHDSKVYLRLSLRIIPKNSHNKNFSKPKIIFVFSRRDSIKSHLFGDYNFSWPHWFVDKSPLDFSDVGRSIEVVEMKSIKDAEKFAGSFENYGNGREKTTCVFCPEKIYMHVRKFIGEKFGYDMAVRAV